MKITKQKILSTLFEEMEIDREDDDNKIVDEFGQIIAWFDYMPQNLKDYFKQTENTPYSFNNVMKATLDYLNQKYDLKRVIVKNNDELAGMLIYSYTTKDNENIDNEVVDEDNNYPVLLATAVHPKYRQRGLLKMMIQQAPVQNPFLVHTSEISTPKVWEKLGCKVVQDLSATHGPGNAVQMCNEEQNRARQILKIRDLAEILSRQFGYDAEAYYEVFLEELLKEYKKNGDEGVLNLFKNNKNGFEIVPMGHGRFYVK